MEGAIYCYSNAAVRGGVEAYFGQGVPPANLTRKTTHGVNRLYGVSVR